jgi:hypothetical protein
MNVRLPPLIFICVYNPADASAAPPTAAQQAEKGGEEVRLEVGSIYPIGLKVTGVCVCVCGCRFSLNIHKYEHP